LPLELAGSGSGGGCVRELLGQDLGIVGERFDWSSNGVSQGKPSMIFGAQFVWLHWWDLEQGVEAPEDSPVQDSVLAVWWICF
jgi:hypothetical protein